MEEEKPKAIRLSSAEKAAITVMYGRGGVWTKESKWVWESAHWTLRVMNSLVRKGLAHDEEPERKYVLTTPGLHAAAALLREVPVFPAQRRKPPIDLPRAGSYRVAGRRGLRG